jgi:hypothetical protein
MTADSTKQSHELRSLRLLASHLRGSLSSNYIVQLLDEFIHQGPNRSHQCLVFKVLRPSVDSIVGDYHATEDNLKPEIMLRMPE